MCVCVRLYVCVAPGGGGLLQHPEGIRLPLCEEGAHLCEGKGGAAHLFPEGKRQARLIHQWVLCHSATSSSGQLNYTFAKTHTFI